MDLGHRDVVVIMLWSVELALLVDVEMHFCTYSKDVEVEDVEQFEFLHDRLGVCSWRYILDESDKLLLCSEERLEVVFLFLSRPPDRDVADEMWACVMYRSLSALTGRSLFANLMELMNGQSFLMMFLTVW